MPGCWQLERVLFNLNAHCSTVFSLSDEKDVHLVGQRCPVHPLEVKQVLSFRELKFLIWNMFLNTSMNTSMLVFHVCFWHPNPNPEELYVMVML
jgi:hypothetical protein